MVLIGMANFLLRLRVNFLEWMILNTCAFVVIAMIIGLILNNKLLMNITVPILFFYGTLSLSVFSWKYSLIPQIGHLLMTAALIYILIATIKNKDFKSLVIGLLIGIIVLIPFMKFQQDYYKSNPKILKYFGDPKFEEFQKKQLRIK